MFNYNLFVVPLIKIVNQSYYILIFNFDFAKKKVLFFLFLGY